MQGDASRDGWCVELLDNGVSIELEALFFLPSLRVNRIFETTHKDAIFKIFVIFHHHITRRTFTTAHRPP